MCYGIFERSRTVISIVGVSGLEIKSGGERLVTMVEKSSEHHGGRGE